ncbi:MAG: chemotaxis protein CheW [Planctomycetia bacterium]|nr:chemotaxis protein CheW [Planctomycetia bacterium]
MEFADAELIADFVVESQEGLADIEQQMLAIEAGGAQPDADLVNAVFRTMHTIKGTAGFLGLSRIGSLAHSLEEVLNGMRNREVATSSELVTSILKAADFMKGLIDSVETSNDADITEHVAAMHRYRPVTEGEATVEAAQAEVVAEPITAPENNTAATGGAGPELSEAVREFLIECYENLDRMDHDLFVLEQNPAAENLLRGIFRTMHTIKGGAGFLGLGALEKLAHTAENLLSKLRDGKRTLTSDIAGALSATVDKCREGLRLVEVAQSDVGFDTESVVRQLLLADRDEKSPTIVAEIANPLVVPAALPVAPAAPSVAPSSIAPVLPTAEAASSEKSQLAAGDSTIRVDVGLLDKLMTRVGELVLARNQIVQFTSKLEDMAFIRTAQRLNLITTELQESVMKMRMQPIGNVWSKFPRVVRDLASQLGKQVRIDMEGKETELDKTIVEAIKDPLTHLVRNSVDHGIEGPEQRRAAGKQIEGCLLLRAYHEGGQVNIEITDDGAGLNLDRIRKKAIDKGLLTPDQAGRMSDRDVAQLIFAPGFSTAEQVTSVSGRGVGMDVVKTNIERISGTIDLQSRPGQGTTIKIKIPLTLAIIPALVVTNDGDRYAIPQVSLLELVRLEGDEVKKNIEYVHGAPVYRLRGKLLPLVYLSQRLGLAERRETKEESASDATPNDRAANDCAANEGAVNIVVLRANDRQFGLVVDKVNDTEEIVVKPLSRQLKGLSEYSGATIMGDGTVALILDVMGLAIAAGLAAEMREQKNSGASKSDEKAGRPLETLLVVDLGDSRRFALPTSMISRLEKVSHSDIEYADGREVIQYRGAILPLVRLSEVFGAAPQAGSPQDELQIVVYADQDHHCGLVVQRIVDIVETELNLSTSKRDDDNLLGTSIIQQRVTDVLNLRRLARRPAATKFKSH